MATRRWLRGTLPLLGEFQPLMSYLSYERVLSSSQQRLASSQHPSACAWNAAGLDRRRHARACEREGKILIALATFTTFRSRSRYSRYDCRHKKRFSGWERVCAFATQDI